MKVILASLTGFLAAFFLILTLYLYVTRSKQELYRRLRGLGSLSVNTVKGKEEKEQSTRDRIKKLLGSTSRTIGGQSVIKRFENQLLKADIPLRGEEYLLICIAAVAVPALLGLLATGKVLPTLALALVGLILPPVFLAQAQQRRLKKFNHQLVDSLAIISNSLRAGYSFMQAMELVSREMPAPIGKEFARTFREVNLGAAMDEAMQHLGQRVNSNDLELVLTAVLIQRQIGGNLAEILDNISFTIRERIRIQGEIKTITAQGRLSGLIIGLVPPLLVLLMFMLNPDYIKPLFTTATGWALLAAGGTGELFGVMLIRKIVSIEM